MTIELIMPAMRVESARKVIDELNSQTKLIDKLTIVNNIGSAEEIANKKYNFEVNEIRPGRNIGTNAVWNMMWDSKADYIGMIGDDFGLDDMLIEILFLAFDQLSGIGAVTATIFKDRPMILQKENRREVKGSVVVGRGHFGCALFQNEILQKIPKIPKELFIFYGDNWLGHWLLKLNKPLKEINAGVSHEHKTDLKKLLGYSVIALDDKRAWNKLIEKGIFK